MKKIVSAIAIAAAMQGAIAIPASAIEVDMYKSPTCGCCTKWAKTMTDAGFHVNEIKRDDMWNIKAKNNVPMQATSCHTALIDGYVIEGHVPAVDVERLLKERPKGVVGLTAPGMPIHSPGMQAKGLPASGYTVFSFDKRGALTPFAKY